jgi:hypothetical protein
MSKYMQTQMKFVGQLQKSGESVKIEVPKAIRNEAKRMFANHEIQLTLRKLPKGLIRVVLPDNWLEKWLKECVSGTYVKEVLEAIERGKNENIMCLHTGGDEKIFDWLLDQLVTYGSIEYTKYKDNPACLNYQEVRASSDYVGSIHEHIDKRMDMYSKYVSLLLKAAGSEEVPFADTTSGWIDWIRDHPDQMLFHPFLCFMWIA